MYPNPKTQTLLCVRLSTFIKKMAGSCSSINNVGPRKGPGSCLSDLLGCLCHTLLSSNVPRSIASSLSPATRVFIPCRPAAALLSFFSHLGLFCNKIFIVCAHFTHSPSVPLHLSGYFCQSSSCPVSNRTQCSLQPFSPRTITPQHYSLSRLVHHF